MKGDQSLGLMMVGFLIFFTFVTAITLADAPIRPYIVGAFIAAGAAWWARHRADRADANAQHGLTREQLQHVRDESVWRHADREQPR